MSTLDEFKNKWQTHSTGAVSSHRYEQPELLLIAKARSAHQVNRAIRYFWASFTYQLVMYGLLTHLFIRFWSDSAVQWGCLAGVLLYLPFTIVLMRQFKRVAKMSPGPTDMTSPLQERIKQQYNSLSTFYRFKRGYEYGLIPISMALGVWLLFRLFVEGGVAQHLTGAAITYLLAVLACGWAIVRENRAHFEQPLRNLEAIINEFDQQL